jgi:site-specific recombinase XerD
VASLLYGAGLRLLEGMRLRDKDIDFSRQEITIRDGKGRKDRVASLLSAVREPLQRHLETVRSLYERDLANGLGVVALPDALAPKYPRAGRE